MPIVLAVIIGVVLVGFIGLIAAGNLLKKLDAAALAWELIELDGSPVGPAQFDDVGPCGEGLCPVKRGERWGFADAQGRVVIEPRFFAAGRFAEGRAPAQDWETRRWGYVDRDGAWVVEPTLWDAWPFSEGVAAARVSIGLRTSRISTANPELSAGLLGKDGAWVIPPNEAADAPDRLLMVGDAAEGLVAVERKVGGWGFVDVAGNEVIAPRFSRVKPFSKGLAPVEEGGRWGFVDRAGTVVVPPRFERAEPFREGLAAVQWQGRGMFVDETGAVMLDGDWSQVRSFAEGRAGAEVDGRWGFIDRNGEWVVEPRYIAIHADFSDGVALVERHGAAVEKGLIARDGTPLGFWADARGASDGLAAVRVPRR